MFDICKLNGILKPPEGYTATDALFLTYSLNFKVLDSILTDCGLFQTYGNDVKKAAQHVVCCFQKDRFIPEKNEKDEDDLSFGRLLNKMGRIIGIKPEKGSFHPKLFLLLFQDQENNKLLRLIIGSRNIARTNYFEGVVCLEGTITEQTDKNGFLADFISEKAKTSTAAVSETVEVFIQALRNTDFSDCINRVTDDGSAKYEFVKYPDLTGCDDLTVISPFLGDWNSFIKEQIGNAKDWKIITRSKIAESSLPQSNEDSHYWHLNMSDGSDEHELHAKVYAFSVNGTYHLYIGSANFSENGFGKNDELMLHITSSSCDFADKIYTALNGKLAQEFVMQESSDDSLPEGSELPNEDISVLELAERVKEYLDDYEAATFFTEILGKPVSPETYAEDFVYAVSNLSEEEKDNIIRLAKDYQTNSPLIQRYKDEIGGVGNG